mmetsp:Transcript_26756/g.77226  ORF Transcript_26756/g.77226 Transcript_26756/m.77226 type:complete len:553 (-) Transcript_26756:768-2426(-)
MRRDFLHELEGPEEAVQHRQRELRDELLAASQRRGLGAGQVREPVDEVEGDVALLDLPLVVANEGIAEGREDRTGWRFGLDQPAMIEAQIALGELHREFLLVVQVPVRWQHVRVVIHDVAQGVVMVANGVARGVPVVRRMLLGHAREDKVHLHDVVDSGEGEHRHEPLFVDDNVCLGLEHGGLPLLLEQARLHEQPFEKGPLGVLVEGHALLRKHHAEVVIALQVNRGPVLVDAVAEAILAIEVQAHHPIKGEKSADGALILVADGPARAHARIPRAGRRFGRLLLQQIQIQLREAGQVFVELLQRVLGVRDAPCDSARGVPIGGELVHAGPQCCAGRPALGLHRSDEARLHLLQLAGGDRRQRHAADAGCSLHEHRRRTGRLGLPTLLRALLALAAVGGELRHRHGGHLDDLEAAVPDPGPDVQLRADRKTVLILLAEIEIPFRRGELLALRQSDDVHTVVGGIPDAVGDLVDAVHGVETRVAVAAAIVLDDVAVQVGLLHEVLLLPLLRQSQALVDGLRTPDPPGLRQRTVLGSDDLVVRKLLLGALRPL